MCDTNENGLIDKLELQEMLTSLVEIAKTEKVLPEDVAQLIDSMFEASGFQNKEVKSKELKASNNATEATSPLPDFRC